MFDKNSGHWIILFITAIALGEVLMFPVLGQVTKPVNTVTRPRSLTSMDQAIPSQAIIRLANTKLPHPLIQGQGNLPLQALSGGLSWTMTVKTGEHSGQFLLDTGASISIVTAAWTKLLGLTGTPIPRENTRYAVAGNACREMDATLYTLPPLILDKAQVKGLQALQLSQGMLPEGVMGILGMDVLSRFHFHLDPARRELQLLPPQILPDGDRTFPILNGKVFA
jgi:predicted aspartyl protease